MKQVIKDKLAELQSAAEDISYEIWQISEDESLTDEERDILGGYALDADQLALNLERF